MINLIPPEGYQTVKHEYLLRVGAVYCYLFSVVCILVGVALVPMYVLIGAQITDMEQEALEESGTKAIIEKADREVVAANGVLAQLMTEESTFSMSAAIDEIHLRAPGGILFKTFYIGEAKSGNTTIQVQGVAATREKLIQFKAALEESALFETVEVPISDLAKDVELPFALTILPSK